MKTRFAEPQTSTPPAEAAAPAGLVRYFRSLFAGSHQPPDPSLESTARRRVLVVDDDPVILKTTSLKLNAAGYHVSTALDGAEALNAVAQAIPSFILLDVELPPDPSNANGPVWDGFRLMHWLRGLENTEKTHYIMMSSSLALEYRDRAQRMGAVAFLSKPLDHQRLLSVLKEDLARKDPSPTRRWLVSLFSFL